MGEEGGLRSGILEDAGPGSTTRDLKREDRRGRDFGEEQRGLGRIKEWNRFWLQVGGWVGLKNGICVGGVQIQHGKVFKSRIFGSPTIVSTDVEVSRFVL